MILTIRPISSKINHRPNLVVRLCKLQSVKDAVINSTARSEATVILVNADVMTEECKEALKQTERCDRMRLLDVNGKQQTEAMDAGFGSCACVDCLAFRNMYRLQNGRTQRLPDHGIE